MADFFAEMDRCFHSFQKGSVEGNKHHIQSIHFSKSDMYTAKSSRFALHKRDDLGSSTQYSLISCPKETTFPDI